jgi:hypothetical protein
MIFGRHGLWRLVLRCNVAEEAQNIRLVTAFLTLTGEREGTLSEGVRFLQAARQYLRFT